jgi:hypothetical protein
VGYFLLVSNDLGLAGLYHRFEAPEHLECLFLVLLHVTQHFEHICQGLSLRSLCVRVE